MTVADEEVIFEREQFVSIARNMAALLRMGAHPEAVAKDLEYNANFLERLIETRKDRAQLNNRTRTETL